MKIRDYLLGVATGIIVVMFVLLSNQAHAGNTLPLEDEYRDGNHKVCVYSNGRQTEYVEKSYGGACQSKKYFD